MSESPAKVRLVRCPKCENLLPEITDYSIYQCGGCGAVLSARSKHIESGTISEKSDEESDEGASNKNPKELENIDLSKKNVKNSVTGSENDVKSNASSGRECRSIETTDNLNITQESEYAKPNKIRSRASFWRRRENGFQDNVEEGPSNYHFPPLHDYAELVPDRHDVVDVADDRAELLRKLDELKDQIVRSRPLGDQSKEKLPPHHTHRSSTFSSQVQTFNDPFRPQMLRRASVQAPFTPFDQNPYNIYIPGQYTSKDLGGNPRFHHPSCSCLTCYTNHRQARPPLVPVLPNDPIYYHHDYNHPRFTGVYNPKSHTRWSSELHRPPRGIIASEGRRCGLISGGSPFVVCCSCLELLQVPEKTTKTAQKRMRCASCSEVMVLSEVNKKLVLSVYTDTKRASDKGANNTNEAQGNRKWGSMEFSSEDYDNSGNYDFQSMDRLAVGGPSLTSYKSAAVRSVRSTSSCTSEDDGKLPEANSGDVSVKSDKPSPPSTGSPLQDHFDYSTKYNRAGKGNKSGRSDMEKAALRQSSMKDAAVATEMEISSNEYGISMGTESAGTSRDADQLKNNSKGESFFAGIIKKSFREFSRSSQHVDHGKVNVTVNGHPIPDKLVKKAEKLAGPIQPGEYWYDPRAGFWGMMGCPCRGIIPPFIEEFNFPMPENCADGNTGVFVNGRELHQKDLDLLASRGLPTDKDRSYLIEISGRVLDEDSGNELECLGKLAPTVESKKHGFGMKPPRATT